MLLMVTMLCVSPLWACGAQEAPNCQAADAKTVWKEGMKTKRKKKESRQILIARKKKKMTMMVTVGRGELEQLLERWVAASHGRTDEW